MADDAVIVGGGPSGLAAAIELRRLGAGSVTVIEREREPGGIPRHSDHTGFGARDLRRIMTGPKYARRYRELAAKAGVEVLTETMVTDWQGKGTLWLTGPDGRRRIRPKAVLLATGCRERPRSARLVPGARGPGVMSTATLQQLVYLQGRHDIGGRALVVGAEHVSFSAVATPSHAGASTVALVTELPRQQSLAAFHAGVRVRYRTPVWANSRVSDIRGEDGRITGAVVDHLDSGWGRSVDCDLIVFTADWIPDHELAAMAGLELDGGTRGPLVDGSMRTPLRGVFATGNLVHPAETADACALGGRHAAAAVARYLGGEEWPAGHVRVEVAAPLRWAVPSLIAAGEAVAPRDRVLLRSSVFLRRPRLEVVQGERVLWRGRLARLIPGRSAHIPATWISQVDPTNGPVTIRVSE
jgi:NADPH-dependent 2,4-dienoyl-CoA reductase/sulfur reductase-like enzyme